MSPSGSRPMATGSPLRSTAKSSCRSCGRTRIAHGGCSPPSSIRHSARSPPSASSMISISSMRRARSRRPCWRICRRHSMRRGTPSRTTQRSTLTTTISPTSASRTHRTMRICGSTSMWAARVSPPSSVPIWIVMRRSWTSTMRMGSRRALSPIR